MNPSDIQKEIIKLKPLILDLQKKSNDIKYIDDIELLELLDKLITKFINSNINYNIQFQPADFDDQYNLYYKLKSILENFKNKEIINTVVLGMGPVIYFKIIEKNKYLEEINIMLNNIKKDVPSNKNLSKKEIIPANTAPINLIESKLNLNKLILSKLHPEIRKVSGKLFLDKHYSQAIFDAAKKIEIMVKEKSNIDKSGKDLMLLVFSKNNPKLLINDNSNRSEIDEQEGFMHLFAGLMQGIKDPKSHSEVKLNDSQKSIEYLCLCSLLARKIDDSKLKE